MTTTTPTRRPFLLLGVVVAAAAGCSAAYYAAWEKLGKHKRDLLRDHVIAARDEQAHASEQFEDALTRLKSLTGFDGGELEKTYDRLKKDYDRSVDRADAVRGRIDKVETVAGDLFAEWEREIDELSSERLRRSSRDKLAETRARYDELVRAMTRAEQSMAPVLTQFKDQVLYLKHNLNAQAVGSLAGEVVDIEHDVDRLLADMRAAIAEADAFLSAMPK